VPFETSREAEIACGTLSVDAEPRRGGTKKTITVDDNMLNVYVHCLFHTFVKNL